MNQVRIQNKIACAVAVILLIGMLGAIGSNPFKRNEGQFGGGYGDTTVGTAGGWEVHQNGDTFQDGDATIDGTITGGTFAGFWPLIDNEKALFGTGSDASIYYDGSDFQFDSREVGTGDFVFTGGGTGFGAAPLAGVSLYMIPAGFAASGGTPSAGGDAFVMDSAGHMGMSFLTANNRSSTIFFADTDDDDVGTISYNHVTNILSLRLGGLTRGQFSAYEYWTNSDIGRIVFGAGQDAYIEYNGVDMEFDSQLVGGGSYVFLNGDFDMQGGDLDNSTGTIEIEDTIVLDSVGSTAKINGALSTGDGGTTNYTLFAVDGLQTMLGTARIMKEVQITASNITHPSANPPTLTLVGNALVEAFEATNDDMLYTTWMVPRTYDPGTDLKIHFHWAPSDDNAGNVTWGVEWAIIADNSNEVLTAGTTTQIVNDATETLQDEILNTGNTTLTGSGTGLTADQIVMLRLFRDADASEGGATDNYASPAYLISIDIEYMSDRLGEDDQW